MRVRCFNGMTPRALYIPHGGGPLPIMGEPGHADMVDYLSNIEAEIGRPSAIVLVSAHWERPQPTILANPSPELYFDYYGFPDETYQYSYPAPGSPELADKLFAALKSAGLSPQLDHERGFDHGMFIPLMLMYSDASIPVVQISLVDGLDAKGHIELGRALAPAIADDVLVLGSGMSFHNMNAFGDTPESKQFDQWLESVCVADTDERDREAQLVDWESAPAARFSHPREEHLVPLHVCYGIAGTAATRSFTGQVINTTVAAYSWA